jgi:hypothetical protein
MRTRNIAVLGSLVLLFAASAAAQPGQDKDNDKSHGKPASSASGAPGASASAPGHDRDADNPAGNDKATGKGSPFTGVTETDAQRARRLGHRKDQHDKVMAALQGKTTSLTKDQRDLIAHHNRVAARLEWIQAWAENEKKPDDVKRAQAALAKEDARFAAKLADLASKGGGK